MMFSDINIQKIFDSANPGDTIILPEGDFYGKFKLAVPNVTVKGLSAQKTRLINGDYAKKLHSDGKEFNTFRTYTLAVTAPQVTLESLSVINNAVNPADNGQCVALTVYSDLFTARSVLLDSTQDTLFCGPLPDDLIVRYAGFLPDDIRYAEGSFKQRFYDCEIRGSVDFIFGCADALFDSCRIVSINDGRGNGFVAAPAHSLKQAIGFVFHKCDFLYEKLASNSVYLARPWRDFGKCSFICCSYGEHIIPIGFDKWNDTDRDKTARFSELPLLAHRAEWTKVITQVQAKNLLSYFD